MLDIVNKYLGQLFGDKKAKDLKPLWPRVEEINEAWETIRPLSSNGLRARSLELRHEIKQALRELDQERKELRAEAEQPDISPEDKERAYTRIDELKKERNTALEAKLKELLPLAFGVMKETASRFKDHEEIRVEANDRDRELAAQGLDFLKIEGDEAVYFNHWTAAGTEVKWNMVHYDVQLIGGIVLHEGKIAEMATGEGKTLVSTLPAYLNALSGEGVHIVTVNDYLAKRDCEWMRPIYEFLHVTVDCIEYHQPNSPGRRKAYQADLTYGTNNEFGFDYLRDNMAHRPEDMVQRGHHYAMVDEVDSVLIDDARTPLIISGPTPKGDQHQFFELKPRVVKLLEAQRAYTTRALARARELLKLGDGMTKEQEREAGQLLLRAHRGLPKNSALVKFLSEPGMRAFLQKTENTYMADQMKAMGEIDKELLFVIDEKNNQVDLSERGIELITASGEDPALFVLPDIGTRLAEIDRQTEIPEERLRLKDELLQEYAEKSERIHTINQLLKAYTVFENDVEYIVADGKVKIVDEQTGRVMEGRRYSDGLHQAIEAKENVKIEAATQTYATVTLQNYFRMYHKLAGMTGTAETEAGELWSIYKLDVVVIPTNKPIIRKDRQDLIYKTKREKYNAVIEEIGKLVEAGRPVLVGTTSVEVSELLSRMLTLRKIKHNVLNAKQNQREAEIVAEAGNAGTVTIATNMAGRGTDIKLGPGVVEAGGLAIVGTERHESRRVDRQLRGRSGRQGDPGTSQFFVSLEDDLMRLFGSERMAKYMDRFGYKEGEVIQHSLITKSIERAQKKVEQNNFGIRKRLLEYDDVMNSQREVIYGRRRNALYGDKITIDVTNMLHNLSEELVSQHHAEGNFEALELDALRLFASDLPFTQDEFTNGKPASLTDQLYDHLWGRMERRRDEMGGKMVQLLGPLHKERAGKSTSIMIPYTDGRRGINVSADLDRVMATQGREAYTSFMKGVTLATIDEVWKEHLRELDDLRQSVQNAVYEQKDPLLIYKFESFDLFKTLLGRINRDVLTMLQKGHLAVTEEADGSAQTITQGRNQPAPAPAPKLKTSRNEWGPSSSTAAPQRRSTPIPEALVSRSQPNRPMPEQAEPESVAKVETVRVGEKIGRNDPCPCGSGKKYKACHGKGAA